MTLVVDASVAARWFLSIEKADAAGALLTSGDRLIAPDLVIIEVTNAAWKAVVFGNVPVETANDFVKKCAGLFHELVPANQLNDRAFEIALALRHPVYDCFYLALAEQRACRLVTADERLQRRSAGTPFAALVSSL